MKQIQSITPVRLLDYNNVDAGLISNLNTAQGDKIAVKVVHTDTTQLLIVVEGMFLYFNGNVETKLSFHQRLNDEDSWNSLDEKNIDKSIFPNIFSLLTNNRLVLDVANEILYDTTDVNVNKSIYSNEDGTLKQGFMYYYSALRHGALGNSIEQNLIGDITRRLTPYVVNQ